MSTNDILLELSSGRQMVLLQEQNVDDGCLNGSAVPLDAKKDILGFRPPPPKLRLSLSILNKILKKTFQVARLVFLNAWFDGWETPCFQTGIRATITSWLFHLLEKILKKTF